MSRMIQQSTTAQNLPFFMTLSSDHISPATGKTVTVTLSKNGASFGAAAGSIVETGNGWYYVTGNATDSNTFGPLALHATASGCDNTDMLAADVVGFNPLAALATPTNITAGTITTVSGNVNGSVGSVTGAVGSVTGNVGGTVTTVTNLTNAPTNGDLTATMKTSVGTAVTTATSAIKAKTDQLVFTIANQVDSNALTGGGGLNAAGVRAAIGMASANMDSQLTTILGAVGSGTTYTARAGGSASTLNLQSGTSILECQIGDVIKVVAGTGSDGSGNGASNIVSDVAQMGSATPVATMLNNWQGFSPDGTTQYQVLKTGGAVPAVLSDIWTTALGESYAPVGAVPTPAQALLNILQFLTSSSVSGTTMTVTRRNGSTQALTLTLNSAYPAQLPTSIRQAT